VYIKTEIIINYSLLIAYFITLYLTWSIS